MINAIYRIGLLTGAGLVALSAGPAFAQAEPQGVRDMNLADIVVTAQRREERNQDVPIAITAFSPELLSRNNIKQAQDLNGLVPSMTIGAKGNGSREVQTPTIRGQGATFQAAPGVVMYMNEVPLPAAFTLSMQGGPGNFVDLENVQVLAGPQGTLFGRNTTGGAVLLSPKKPTNDFGGYIEGSIGNYDMRGLEGVLNVPIVDDKLMVRIVGAYQDRDGFTRDIVWNKDRDDVHWYMGRVGILMKPTERLTNYFMAYGARSSTNGPGIVNNGFNIPLLQAFGLCGAGAGQASCDVYQAQSDLQADIGPRKVRHGLDDFQKVRTWGLTNTTDLELNDELTARNIVSFQKFWGDFSYDGDGTPLQQYDRDPYHYPDGPVAGLSEFGLPQFGYLNAVSGSKPRDDLKQFTEELQLQGKVLDGKMDFTVGGFYYNLKPAGLWEVNQVVYCPALFTGVCQPTKQYAGVSNKSKALYAQATIDLGLFTPALDNLRFTAGYRYTWDTIAGFASVYGINSTGNLACSFDNHVLTTGEDPYSTCLFSQTLKSKAPTWTVGLDYKPMNGLLLYAKISHGYKAGGFNPYAVRMSTLVFQPEKLTSYEGGFKFDTRLGSVPARLNATYYYADYKDIQQSAGDFNTVTGANGAQFVQRDGTIQGVEVEAMVKPATWLQLGGTLSYTHGKYKDSSFDFQYIVPWLYNVNATVDLPIPENLGSLNLYANYSHQSPQATDALEPASQPGQILEAYGLLNLSLNWKNVARSNVDVSLFMNNATNKLYRIMNTNVWTSLLTRGELYGEPRMYGVKLRYRFGS